VGGGVGAGLIFNVYEAGNEGQPLLACAETLKVEGPEVVAFPIRTPVDVEKVRPAGGTLSV
jgi:hypothetical protein